MTKPIDSGITRAGLAERLGVSRSWMYEKGNPLFELEPWLQGLAAITLLVVGIIGACPGSHVSVAAAYVSLPLAALTVALAIYRRWYDTLTVDQVREILQRVRSWHDSLTPEKVVQILRRVDKFQKARFAAMMRKQEDRIRERDCEVVARMQEEEIGRGEVVGSVKVLGSELSISVERLQDSDVPILLNTCMDWLECHMRGLPTLIQSVEQDLGQN